jgi:nicotinate-nucleotide pyrophosphorylase (carboxylating)
MSERPSESELALIDAALAEDIGKADWTTRWTISEEARGSARIVARADGVIAGTRPAEATFRRLDPELRLDWRCVDGEGVQAGSVVAELSGRLEAATTIAPGCMTWFCSRRTI